MENKKDNAGVYLPPPLFYVAIFLVALFLQREFPINPTLFHWQSIKIIGIIFIVIGLFFLLSGFKQFFQSKNTLITIRPANSLQTNGMYHITRNPMYLGLAIIYLGLSCLIGNWWNLILFPFLLLLVQQYIIKKEEKYLVRRFGNEYAEYKNKVGRWTTLKSKNGILAMLLCFLTLGTGASSNLWSSIAKDWHVSADVIAVVTGVMGGLLSALGCMLGGWPCDRMDRRNAYLLFGLISAACAVGMAYSPRTEMMFVIWTSVYAVALGLCYAGFTAFTLEAIGKGAAATKYNIFAALSNSPIYFMTYVVGIAYTHGGDKGMLNTEAAFAVGAVVVFLVLQKILFKPKIKVQNILAAP